MLTDDKTITTPAYWDKVYRGENNDAKVDASNTKRPARTFDRFDWVAGYAEGPAILGVASGHAHIEKRIKARHPEWQVIASDQSEGAKEAAKYSPYWIVNAYKLPILDNDIRKDWSMIICAQALEYMTEPGGFLFESQCVAKKILFTVPIGEMDKWSQLRIYTEENVREFVEEFGEIEIFDRHGDLLLVKLKFYPLP
jgi:hypothetical protein